MSDDSELWAVGSASEPMLGLSVGPAVLCGVHSRRLCAGEVCVMHSPSDHHMRDWRTHWRGDKGLMERTCPHGIGHPDPDDLAYQRSQGRGWQAVHGCDGCCMPREHAATA